VPAEHSLPFRATGIEGQIVIKRKLGRSGLEAVPLALGGNVFGWTANEATSFEVLDAFAGAGFNLIDTANSYSSWVPGNKGGESETVIGNWLRQRPGMRQKVLLATKVGADLGVPERAGLSRAVILKEIEGSLQRLGTDYIDLYQTHFDDLRTPVEETLGAYGELVRAGKVRVIGASNMSAERLAQSLKVSREQGLPRYETLQPHYNLHVRDQLEGPLLDLCRREEIGIIPYFSLASGFLTGKYRSSADFGKSPRGQRMASMLDARGLRILGALDQVAGELSATPAQVSLAWLLAHGVAAPIASATSVTQLTELLRGASLELPAGAVQRLDAASATP
jgi:aryl-alcohol dehydrogenase-like predicted oxidoreductase